MALVVICGQPCSGKSTASLCLAAALELVEPAPSVRIIDESSLHLGRNQSYADMTAEKNLRGVLRSEVDRSLSKDCIIIIDSLNNIKGYRYELWCLARAAGIRYCVLFCDADENHCRVWNNRRGLNGEASYDTKMPFPPSMTVSSFSGDIYRPAGYATLRVTLEYGPRKETKQIGFIIIDAPSGYNAILGRPAMAAFHIVRSTYHLCVKFPTLFGVATIRGDKVGAKKCFEINAHFHTDYLDLRDHTLPPDGQNDHVTVADKKSVLIFKDFPEIEKPALAALLSECFDVFAWGLGDMPE